MTQMPTLELIIYAYNNPVLPEKATIAENTISSPNLREIASW